MLLNFLHKMGSFFGNHGGLICNILIVIITGCAFYYQFWKPFDPSSHLNGRYKLSINPIGNRIYQTAITFGINFTNSGARVGFIDCVLLKLTGKNQTYKYIAAFNDLNEKIAFPVSGKSQLKALEYLPFSAFEIPAHTTITKEIFFVPYDHVIPRLSPGEYTVSVYIKYSKNEMYEKMPDTKIVIEPEDNKGFPDFKTFEEAQAITPSTMNFFTRSKILPEVEELIKKIQ